MLSIFSIVDSMIKKEITYFKEGGEEHSEATLDLSIQRAKELGIKKIVVASNRGVTGVMAAEKLQGTDIQLIVVGHQTGFPKSGVNQFLPENHEKIESLGGIVNLGSDVMTNSIRQRGSIGASPISIITQTLIAMKVKVNVEIILKACDMGQLTPGEHVISVAGSHKGADTSAVFIANESANILRVKPLEYIAMPYTREKSDKVYMDKRKAS